MESLQLHQTKMQRGRSDVMNQTAIINKTRTSLLMSSLNIPSHIIRMMINRVGLPALHMLYRIVKRTTSTADQHDDSSQNNIKIVLAVIILYYASFTTYYLYNGYKSNLVQLFEPFAALESSSSSTSTPFSLMQFLKSTLRLQ